MQLFSFRRGLLAVCAALLLPPSSSLAQARSLSVDEFEELLELGVGVRAAARLVRENCWAWGLTSAEERFLSMDERMSDVTIAQLRASCVRDANQRDRLVDGAVALAGVRVHRARVSHVTSQSSAVLEEVDTLVAGVDRLVIGEIRLVGAARGQRARRAVTRDVASPEASASPVSALFERAVGAEVPTCVTGPDTAAIVESVLILRSPERAIARARFVAKVPDDAPSELVVRCTWKNARLTRAIVVRPPRTTEERRAQLLRLQLCVPASCMWGEQHDAPVALPISADSVLTATPDGSRHVAIQVSLPSMFVRILESAKPATLDIAHSFHVACFLTPLWGGALGDEAAANGHGTGLVQLSTFTDTSEPFRHLDLPLSHGKSLPYLLMRALEEQHALGFLTTCDLDGMYATGSVVWVAAAATR